MDTVCSSFGSSNVCCTLAHPVFCGDTCHDASFKCPNPIPSPKPSPIPSPKPSPIPSPSSPLKRTDFTYFISSDLHFGSKTDYSAHLVTTEANVRAILGGVMTQMSEVPNPKGYIINGDLTDYYQFKPATASTLGIDEPSKAYFYLDQVQLPQYR